jgi:hypothetical protein
VGCFFCLLLLFSFLKMGWGWRIGIRTVSLLALFFPSFFFFFFLHQDIDFLIPHARADYCSFFANHSRAKAGSYYFVVVFFSFSQVLQESIRLPGTDVHLVYHSSEAAGYMSLVRIQMTPDEVPRTLRLVHLRCAVEGVVLEKVFEADPNLKYTFAWNRLNAYKQKVYGIVTARGMIIFFLLSLFQDRSGGGSTDEPLTLCRRAHPDHKTVNHVQLFPVSSLDFSFLFLCCQKL